MSKKQAKDWRDPRQARKICEATALCTIFMKIPLKYKGVRSDLKPDLYSTLARRFVFEFGYSNTSLRITFFPVNGTKEKKEYFWSARKGLFGYSYVLKNIPSFPEIKRCSAGAAVRRRFSFDGDFVEID